MDFQQEYDAALKAFYQVWRKANEAKDVARKAFQRMAKEKHGVGAGDVIEYDGMQGVFSYWDYPMEIRNKDDSSSYIPFFYPYKKDGSLSTQKRYIYNINLVKVIKRVEETQKEHQE